MQPAKEAMQPKIQRTKSDAKEAGRISLVMGPMKAGKTEEMIRQIRVKSCAFPAVVINHSGDTRFADNAAIVMSHGGQKLSTVEATKDSHRIRVVAAAKLEDVKLEEDEQFVGINEGQFFADIEVYPQKWANEGREVIVAALDGDFKGKPFPTMVNLPAQCENVIKLSALCMGCKRAPGAFTVRISGGEDLILVGAGEYYRTYCRTCRNSQRPE